jgi:PKD repeat protein
MKLRIILIAFLCIGFYACQEDDQLFGDITVPSNLVIDFEIVGADADNPDGDGSGQVNFNFSADNAITYKFFFGDNTEAQDSDGRLQKTYNLNGVNTYNLTAVAFGTAGVSSSITTEVTVRSDFEDPETFALLAGGDGNTKTWYVAFAENGHLGVGPTDGLEPSFFAASANQLADCFYDDVFTITQNGTDLVFTHNNQEVSFFNNSFLSVGGGGGPDDQCLPFDTSGDKFLTLAGAGSIFPNEDTTGTAINLADGGFFGYYVNAASYEVLEITENFMRIRCLSGNAEALAWYQILTTNPDGTID